MSLGATEPRLACTMHGTPTGSTWLCADSVACTKLNPRLQHTCHTCMTNDSQMLVFHIRREGLRSFESTVVHGGIPLAHSRQYNERAMYLRGRNECTAAGGSCAARPDLKGLHHCQRECRRCIRLRAPMLLSFMCSCICHLPCGCLLAILKQKSIICPPAVGTLGCASYCPEHTTAQSRAVFWQFLKREELLYTASSTRAYPCWSIQGLAGTALRLRVSSQPGLYSDCARPAAEHVQCCLVTSVSLQGRYLDLYMSWPPAVATCDSKPCSLSSKPRQCCSFQPCGTLQLP